MKTITILPFILLVSFATAFCQDAKISTLSSEDWNEQTDFAEIRLKYASEPGYNAYLATAVEKVLIAEAMREWDTGDKAEALAKLKKVTEDCPVSIEAYRRLADGFAVFIESTKDPEKKSKLEPIERHYRIIAEGLLKSIVASGDGKTIKTAYKVISIPEEYMTLWYLGFRPGDQSVTESGGLYYDMMKVKHRITKRRVHNLFRYTGLLQEVE